MALPNSNPVYDKIKRFRYLILAMIIVIAMIPVAPLRDMVVMGVLYSSEDTKDEPAYPYWVGDDSSAPKNEVDALRFAECNADHTSGQSYWDMIHRYPRNPALYAGVFQYYLKSSGNDRLHFSRPEVTPPVKGEKTGPRLNETPSLAQARAAITAGKTLEPDNAFFDLCDAYLLFGTGRDPEGLAAIHRASTKKQYNSHEHDILNARLKYGTRPAQPVDFLQPMWKFSLQANTMCAYLAAFHAITRIAMWDAGHRSPDQLSATTVQLTRIGCLMRDRSPSAIEAISGANIQVTAARCAYNSVLHREPIERGPESTRKPQGADKPRWSTTVTLLHQTARDRFSAYEWRYLDNQGAESDRFQMQEQSYLMSLPVTEWIVRSEAMLKAEGRLLVTLFWCGVLWLITIGWLAIRRKLSVRDVGPSPLLIWLITAIPSLPFRWNHLTEQQYMHPLYAIFAGAMVGVSVGIIPVVVIASVLRTRMIPGLGRFDTFAARMRRGLSVAAAGLAIFYVLTVLVSIPLAAQTNREMDSWLKSETQYIRTHYPLKPKDSVAAPNNEYPHPQSASASQYGVKNALRP
jgi:hypothetical protein